ncbi:Dihydroorotate dehydrogenase-domain-containing protein [Mycena filopes]|nr:Dihydroorotate dehydrogenase-domain-containing protein [Mycena filopes]
MLRSHQSQLFRSALARGLFTRAPPPPRTPIRNALYGTVFVLSAGLFTIYYLDARSGIHRYVFAPLLRHTLDAETGHKVAVQLWGFEISNPVGLAAGFDKNGEAIDGLFNLGFSWVEIGSVTPKPQAGNPRPRVFHLPEDAALINRYGFPSEGHTSVLSRLRARIPRFFGEDEAASAAFRPGAVLAVNLGKNKESPVDSIEDFVAGVRTFGPHSDVLVVNVSSPNTPGLRGLQNRDLLEALLAGVTQAREDLPASTRKPKLVLKIAPDLTEAQLVEIAGVIQNTTIDGIIVSNTTTQRPSELLAPNQIEIGGLSGAPLKQYSLAALRTLRKNLPARIPLIGCGGISTGADALEYAKAGASLVQVYTGFGYDGAGACRRIKDQLVDALAQEGMTWTEVVNKAVSELSLKKSTPLRRVEKVLAEDANPSLKQLIAEAEELKKLLDQFGETQEMA